jgi:hypothetical protein
MPDDNKPQPVMLEDDTPVVARENRVLAMIAAIVVILFVIVGAVTFCGPTIIVPLYCSLNPDASPSDMCP